MDRNNKTNHIPVIPHYKKTCLQQQQFGYDFVTVSNGIYDTNIVIAIHKFSFPSPTSYARACKSLWKFIATIHVVAVNSLKFQQNDNCCCAICSIFMAMIRNVAKRRRAILIFTVALQFIKIHGVPLFFKKCTRYHFQFYKKQ